MAYFVQFLRGETFARKPRQGRPGLEGVIREAARDPSFCPHIDSPRPPNVLHGVHPSSAVDLIEDRLAGAVDRLGRTIPSTTCVMLGFVTSWPEPVTWVETDPDARSRYLNWRERVVAVCCERWGDDVISIIEHTDEAFPHLHIWIVPKPAANGVFDLEAAFPPLAAQGAARRAGGNRAAIRAAFSDAARREQDWYYEQIGRPCGLARIGPKRPRLSRRAYLEQRAKELAAMMAAEAQARVASQVEAIRNDAAAHIAATEARFEREKEALKQHADTESQQQLLAIRGALLPQIREMLRSRERELSDLRTRNAELLKILADHGLEPECISRLK